VRAAVSTPARVPEKSNPQAFDRASPIAAAPAVVFGRPPLPPPHQRSATRSLERLKTGDLIGLSIVDRRPKLDPPES